LKLVVDAMTQAIESRRKKPKTLSGIETDCSSSRKVLPPITSRKKPKTLSGIETTKYIKTKVCERGRKKPKTLSGIETYCWSRCCSKTGRKKPKTLSGIETGLVSLMKPSGGRPEKT